MSGLKNLVPKGVLCEDNYTVLKKKSEEYRRSISYFTGHIHQMVHVYFNYYELIEGAINEASNELQLSKDANQQLYVDLIRTFCGLNAELRRFVDKASGNEKSMVELSNVFMTDYVSLIEDFQSKGRQYFEGEANVVQTSRKYFVSYRDMMSKVEAYKNTFLDVKLIYNNQQKLRLYNDCLVNYKKLEEMSFLIQIKVDDLNAKKSALAQSYRILERQLGNFTTSFASRYIEELRKFYEALFKAERNRLAIFTERSNTLKNSPFPSYFQTEINLAHQELISDKILPSSCRMLPAFVVYCTRLKEEGVFRFRRCMASYLHEMTGRAERRRRLARMMFEFIRGYIRALEKNLTEWIRETLQSFEKMRRKIGEAFGSRWISFYKIIASVFENSIENTGRLVLRTTQLITRLQNFVASESNMMGDFVKELKTFVEKHVPRKVLKLLQPDGTWKQQELLPEEKAVGQDDIYQGSQFVTALLDKYGEVGAKLYEEGRTVIGLITVEIRQSLGEYFTFFNEVQNTYYDEQEYAKSYQQFQQEVGVSVKKGMQFFNEIQLSAIINDNSKITFDNEFNKLEAFKKIKKPKEFEELEGRNSLPLTTPSTEAQSGHHSLGSAPPAEIGNKQGESISNILNKDIFMGEVVSKNAEFLLKRITLEINEKYLKSFSCSLSDTVILAGRLFVTSHRICFYSKFNSNNLFFGETFIEIPKADIKKIEKRSMSFLSDHAISITTLHGCMLFRSFFSREEAYETIRKNFEINSEEIFFEEDENNEEALVEAQQEYEDDLKGTAALEREARLAKSLAPWSYHQAGAEQFTCYGLTVVKFLKLFQVDQQVNINRTSYPSFLHYYKDLCQHTDINIQPWSPNPLEHLNVLTIKEEAPESFTRRITAVIPLPPSGIPFMPKQSLTTEDQTLFLLSGSKAVFEMVVKNSGVPYCEAFDVRVRKTVEAAGENKVRVSAEVFVNFTQNVMVKSTIEAKTIEGVKEGFDIQFAEIRNYLKILEKKMAKGGRKETPEDRIREQEETIAQLSASLKEAKEKNKALEGSSLALSSRVKTLTIVSGVLLLMVLVEGLLLLS